MFYEFYSRKYIVFDCLSVKECCCVVVVSGEEEDDGGKKGLFYVGGWVFELKKGLYDIFVFVFDY